MGETPKETMTAEEWMLKLKPAQIRAATALVMQAISDGWARRGKRGSGRDTGRVAKKNGERLTKAQYLNLTLQMGMTVREAMLERMRTVFEICDLRAEARRKARKRG